MQKLFIAALAVGALGACTIIATSLAAWNPLEPKQSEIAAERADWNAHPEKRRLWVYRHGDMINCRPAWCESAGEALDPTSTGRFITLHGRREWASAGDAYCLTRAELSNAETRAALDPRSTCMLGDFRTPGLLAAP
jgi:hypothetical protein